MRDQIQTPSRSLQPYHLVFILYVFFILLFFLFAPRAYSAEVTLAWNQNPEANLLGYKVYYKTGSSGEPYNGTGAVQGPSPISVPIEEITDPHNPEFILTGLVNDEVYFFVATAYNSYGESDYSKEVVSGVRVELAVGLGPYTSNGGWIKTFTTDYSYEGWYRIIWSASNADNREVRIATGDIDSDGRDEVVVGLGPVDGESAIPAGLFEVLDDDYSHLAWGCIQWSSYNSVNGETWPACGDLDGDGRDEIVVGLGTYPTNGGWIEVFDYAGGAVTHNEWLRVNWSDYNSVDGETRPACGDLDGDGRDEIVVGFGTYPTEGGWMAVFDDAVAGYAELDWARVNWDDYNSSNGETRPACGDVDGDGRDEIVVGFGTYPTEGGWIVVFDDAVAGYAELDWARVNWDDYNSSNGETRPACGDLDCDGRDEIVVGLGTYPTEGGWIPVFDDAVAGYSELDWARVNWDDYNSANGETLPAVKK